MEGYPLLRLNAGPEAFAVYSSSGSDDEVLSFLYTVSAGDQTRDLDVDGEHSLVVPERAAIQVAANLRSPSL